MSIENRPAHELSPSCDFLETPIQTIVVDAAASGLATAKEVVPYLDEQLRIKTIREPYSWGRYFVAASFMAPIAISSVLLANAGFHYTEALKDTKTMAENVWWGEVVPMGTLVTANITAMFASMHVGKPNGFLERAINHHRRRKQEESNPAWFFNKDLRWVDAGDLDWGNLR